MGGSLPLTLKHPIIMATPKKTAKAVTPGKTAFTIVRAGENYILIERPSPSDEGLMDEAWLRTSKRFEVGDSIEISNTKVKQLRWT